MKALIIEDEAPAFRRLQNVLEEVNPNIKIVEVIDSVKDSVAWFLHNPPPDVIFMDIQLSDGLSFEIFDAVKITCPVVFTTAFDEYMLRAFKVNSIDYLLKPIKKEDLLRSLQKLEEIRDIYGANSEVPDLNALIREIKLDDKRYKERFLVKKGEELISVRTADVAYFQSRNGIVYLYALNGNTYWVDFNLDELGQLLDPQKFYRANRQFIINYDAVKKVHRYHKGKLVVEMTRSVDDPITISTEKASDFKSWLGS